MSVWFAYRCHYALPAARFVKCFDEPTLLEWFRNHCKPIADVEEAYAYLNGLFGIVPYGMEYLLTRLAEENVQPPRNNRELREAFDHWSVKGDWLFQPHAIQGLDDDDEAQMAFYVFDEVFARKYPERVACLMHEDWQLPGDAGTGPFVPAFRTTRLRPRGNWEGTTYLVFLVDDTLELTDMNVESYRLDGVRLPQLARLLARTTEAEREDYEWGVTLLDLAGEVLADGAGSEPMEEAFLQELRSDPHDDAVWAVYGDWLEEHGRPRAELWLLQQALARIGTRPVRRHPHEVGRVPNLSRWRVEPHLAQLSLHQSTLYHSNCFDHWIVFDDLWASAHPDLANSLLRQLERWDVLSSPRRPRSE